MYIASCFKKTDIIYKISILKDKGGVSMGLGLIALGFLLLEGFQLTINTVQLLPQYMARAILIIGLLVIRKKVKIQYFEYALYLGILIFMYDLVVPIFDLSLMVEKIALFCEIVAKILFIVFLFKGILKLKDDQKTRKLMIVFLGIYVFISLLLLFDVWNAVLMGFLLFIKSGLCCWIAYRIYKKNKELIDVYETLEVVHTKKLPKFLLVLMMVVGIMTIAILNDPFVNMQKETAQISYAWYGEIENKVIVSGLNMELEHYYDGSQWTVVSPIIWLNKTDYEKAVYAQIILQVGDEQNKIYASIEKKINLDESYGQRQGYYHLFFDEDINVPDAFTLYENRHHISLDIQLFDNNQHIIKQFVVPLKNRDVYQQSYHYKDDTLTVSQLKIHDDYITQLPEVIYHDDQQEDYHILLSSSPDGKQYIDLTNIYTNEKSDDNPMIYSSCLIKETYYSHQNEYYLHIAYFENDELHFVKTVRLEES